MQRLLHIILTISILVSQSAWAISGTNIEKLDGGNTEHSYTQPAEQHDALSEACNHFCHASAHLVGLFSDSVIELSISRDSYIETSKNETDSRNDQPSIPPPIS